MSGSWSRRAFVRAACAAGAGWVILGNSRSARSYQANEKLNVALIGVGGRGSWFVGCIPRLGQNVVAMCDVNEHKASRSFEQLPKAKKFFDFRRMFDQMAHSIDAVVVATPDNTHAVAAAMAIRLGKAVYCEKPLTHDVAEASRLKELAEQFGVATQMGNQGTASEAFRRAVELVWAGVIGPVQEVHAWNTGGGPGSRPIPSKVHPVPAYLHWDLWLGPAKYRPYNSRWLNWHGWRDFGTGQLGNWGCHTLNLPFKALRLDLLWQRAEAESEQGAPIRVVPEVSDVDAASFPRWEILRYELGRRGSLGPVRLYWYNGAGRAPGCRERIEKLLGRKLDWGDAGQKRWADHAGVILLGRDGLIWANAHNTVFELLPKDKFAQMPAVPHRLARSRGHEAEWLAAARGEATAMSHFGYASALTELVLLGNVATLLGRAISYDPVAGRVIGDEQAQAALSRVYRSGWRL